MCLKRKIEIKKKIDEHRRGKTKPKKRGRGPKQKKHGQNKKKQKKQNLKALRGKIYNIKN
jgi:hypothetical protein